MTPSDRHRLIEETWIAAIETHDSLPSTNDRAAELAKVADTELPLLVIADVQTAGRGRGGNRWWTGADSLAFSVLFDSPPAHEHRSASPILGLAAALAIVESVRPFARRSANRPALAQRRNGRRPKTRRRAGRSLARPQDNHRHRAERKQFRRGRARRSAIGGHFALRLDTNPARPKFNSAFTPRRTETISRPRSHFARRTCRRGRCRVSPKRSAITFAMGIDNPLRHLSRNRYHRCDHIEYKPRSKGVCLGNFD